MHSRRSLNPASVPVLLAALSSSILLGACAGTKFETDDEGAAATATNTTTTASSEITSGTEEPATSPNVPPVPPVVSPQPTEPSPDETTAETPAGQVTTSTDEASSAATTPADETSEATPAPAESSEPAPSTTGENSAPPSGVGDVPDTEHCAPVADWDPAWAQWEQEVLTLVNENRAAGANCDTEGEFGPADPLTMEPMLRCSARLHSMDMFERDFFDHTNPDGLDPFDRMAEAGFEGSYMGENIAYGQPSPEQVMADWMESDGHCSNIMNPNFTLIGVGYHAGADNPRDGKHFWTQNFGTPLMQGGGFGGRFGGATTN